MNWFYVNFVQGNQKAIVGFVAVAVAAYANQHGINLNMTLKEGLEACLWGLLGLMGVYFKRNQ